MASMTPAVANRYVTALADVVNEAETGIAPEDALGELVAVQKLLEESGDLVAVLNSPAIRPDQKRRVVAEIGERLGLTQIVRGFFQVVVERRHVAGFAMIVNAFRSWLDAYRSRVQIEVRMAEAIDDAQRAVLERRFAEITGKRVRATYVVDHHLLGGTSVQVGSTLFDGSLRAALGSLAGELGAPKR